MCVFHVVDVCSAKIIPMPTSPPRRTSTSNSVSIVVGVVVPCVVSTLFVMVYRAYRRRHPKFVNNLGARGEGQGEGQAGGQAHGLREGQEQGHGQGEASEQQQLEGFGEGYAVPLQQFQPGLSLAQSDAQQQPFGYTTAVYTPVPV